MDSRVLFGMSNRNEDVRVTYGQLNEGLAMVGGIDGLLVALNAMLPNLPPAVLDGIEQGVRDGIPVALHAELPGITYHVYLAGEHAESDATGA